MKTKKEITQEFNAFIESIPNQLDLLKKYLYKDTLTFAKDEIDLVQKWYKRYHRKRRLKRVGLTKEGIDLMCTAYLGTAFLWHFGGKWELETSKSGPYGDFQLVEYGGEGYTWVAITPRNWLRSVETKQNLGLISEIFDSYISTFEQRPEYQLKPVRTYKQ